MQKLGKLLSIGAGPVSPGMDLTGVPSQLAPLYTRSNGLYAFESALHVFPARPSDADVIGLTEWNSPTLWRDAYDGLAEDCYFFAEDVFGGQFALRHEEFVTFDPETGEVEHLAADIEGWAERLLADYELLTGYPLAHEWQNAHGALASGVRLVPKQPFVLGGGYVLENLRALPAVQGMRSRGELAVRIRDLPDGSTITFEITD